MLHKKRMVISLICIIAVVSLSGCTANNMNDAYNNAAAYTDTKADAYRVACDAVREKLEAPSKAVFPTYSSSYVSQSSSDDSSYDTMYTVSTYVEAANTLGGTSKLYWSAVAYTSEGDNQFHVRIESIE
jgi:hypothetical protein